MDGIISILENPEKIKELISKLKTICDHSLQFQTFKKSIDSFHLNKPPRGLHEKNILQHTFKYSDSRECFDNFRLVCKSWKFSVETIRLNRHVPDAFFDELCLHSRNDNFSPFYSKYLKIFKNLCLDLEDDFDMKKWNSISNLLLNNMKNLGKIIISVELTPPNFTIFLFKLFENSQSTLKQLSIFWATEDVLALPTIFLPNLHFCYLYLHPRNKIDADTFDYLMKSFVSSCKHLKTFQLQGYDNRPKILKYIRKYYPNHFVDSPGISTSLVVHVPLKRSCLDLQDLAQYRYASCIEYLVLKLHSMEIYNPTEGDWEVLQRNFIFLP